MTENTLPSDPVEQAKQALREAGDVNYSPLIYRQIIGGLLRKIDRMAGRQTEHVLKCWPGFFRDFKAGIKPFEVRRNDRDYQVGDVLVLTEWNPETQCYTGDVLRKKVIYLMSGALAFLPYQDSRGGVEVGPIHPDFVVLGLGEVPFSVAAASATGA